MPDSSSSAAARKKLAAKAKKKESTYSDYIGPGMVPPGSPRMKAAQGRLRANKEKQELASETRDVPAYQRKKIRFQR
jgi:hypothetical protein